MFQNLSPLTTTSKFLLQEQFTSGAKLKYLRPKSEAKLAKVELKQVEQSCVKGRQAA